MQNSRSWTARLGAALLTGALVLPVAAQAQTKVGTGFNMYSAQQDAQLGAQAARQVQQQLPLVHGRIEQYVDAIGERLARHAPGPRFDYQFAVVDASDLNAFALPGGYVYLNRGILESARTEGEVAGVIAHEIAHSALRHATANQSKGQLTQVGAGLVAALLGREAGPRTAQAINIAGNLGLGAIMMKYSRSAENDADILGAQIMAKAGYDPREMASFFHTLSRSQGRSAPTWLSSHPNPRNRAARVEQEARLLGGSYGRAGSTSQLASVQRDLSRRGDASTTEQILRRRAAAYQHPRRR